MAEIGKGACMMRRRAWVQVYDTRGRVAFSDGVGYRSSGWHGSGNEKESHGIALRDLKGGSSRFFHEQRHCTKHI